MFDRDSPTLSRRAALVAAALFTLSTAAFTTAVRAQAPGDRTDRGGGYFQVGYMMLDVDGLNGTLAGAGYPQLDESFVTLGGGGFGMKGPFLIGGEGHAVIGSTETTVGGATQLGLGGGYGLFRVGYLAYSYEDLDVFPMLGVGGGGVSLTLVDRSAPTFDDVLADPERSSNLSTGSFLLDASLAAFYRFSFTDPPSADEDDGPGGLLLGLQAGYTFAPGDSSWNLDTINNVAGGPDMKIQGFYVRLAIGGWGGG
jgi:hypothetical protein